jgi:hypothetical protein
VYSSGIPTLKHAPKVSTGLKVSGTITQTGVGEEFEADIPIEVQYVRGGPAQTFWVRTSTNEPVDYSFALKQPAAKVTIGAALLRAD